MADTYLTLSTTPAGRNMIVRSLYGDSITFTRIAIGNGVPSDPSSVTEMVNPLLSISLTEAEPTEDYMLLTGYVSSSQIVSSFYGYEIGVYAKNDNNEEFLFGYRYSSTDVDFYPAADSGRALELNLTVVVQLGNAENVTAILIEGDIYATKLEFDAHVNDHNNPHQVSAEDVGLGNVPNVTTNGQTPTYTRASARANLVSGETLSVAFGKISKAIFDLINHLANTNNPHGVTATQIGAAASGHTHSAADINSGTLAVARGGTGSSTLYGSDLAKVRTATLTAAGWTNAAPYTQSISVTGITANDAPIISAGLPSTINAANYTTLIKNYAMIDRAVTAAGKITFYCYRKKPTAAIPLYIKGV